MITAVKGSQIRMNNYFNKQSHVDVLWEMGYTGEGIRVGIVDTGIQDLSHPSICDNIIKGHNWSLDGSGRNNITSSSYHGLAVASLVTYVAPRSRVDNSQSIRR